MKKLMLVLLSIIPLIGISQRAPIDLASIFPIKDKKICYSEIVVLNDTISKEALFNKVKNAVSSVLKSNTAIIQSESLIDGSIVSKGFIVKAHNSYVENPQLWFTLKIDVKNNKYRYELTNVIYQFSVSVSTAIYGNSITNHQNVNSPFEDWIKPDEKRGKANRTAIETFLKEIDAEFKLILSNIKTQVDKKEEVW